MAHRYTVVLSSPSGVMPDGTLAVTATVIEGGAPKKNTQVNFYLNGALASGPLALTNDLGNANWVFTNVPLTMPARVKAEAALENKPNSGDILLMQPAAAPVKKAQPDIALWSESNRGEPGKFVSYVLAEDPTTSLAVPVDLQITTDGQIKINGAEYGPDDEIIVHLPATGMLFRFENIHPERKWVEIDVIARGHRRHLQFNVSPPPREPIRATKRDPGIVKLFDGCE